jgi:hypothetical protein
MSARASLIPPSKEDDEQKNLDEYEHAEAADEAHRTCARHGGAEAALG